MDRFSETLFSNAKTSSSPEPETRCPNCGRLAPESEIQHIASWDFDGCAECQAQCALLDTQLDAENNPLCPVEYELLIQAANVADMKSILRAHQGAECVYCASTRKTVLSDREVLNQPAAACCEGKAA